MKNQKGKSVKNLMTTVMLIICIILCAVVFCSCSNTAQNEAVVSDTSLETEQQTEEITEEPEEVKEEFVLSVGEWNGNKYTNESVGITLELPDDWMFYDYAELAEFNGISNAESMTIEEYEEAVRENFSSYGWLWIAEAVSNSNYDRISIHVYDKEKYFDNAGYKTVEEYINAQRTEIEEHYALNDAEGQLSEIASMDLCGMTFYYFDDINPWSTENLTRRAYALCDGCVISIDIISWHYWEGCMEEYCSYFK